MIYTHVAAALLGAALAAVGTWKVQDWRLNTQISTIKAEHAEKEATRAQVALDDARETFRKGEIHARNQKEIADVHAAQTKRRLAGLATAAADGERLRLLVKEYAATCGGGKADSPASALQHCRDRAATLGVLHEQADRQAEEFAGAAEQHADEIRTLKRTIENDRALLSKGGLGFKPPRRPDAGSSESPQ